MKRAVSVFGVLAVLFIAILAGCGEDEESTGTSADSTSQPQDFEASCVIGTAVLGVVVALATKGKELEEIGEAVSSKFGGDVLSAACETAVTTFINQPQAEVQLELEDVPGLAPTFSFEQLRKTLTNPPPEPEPGSEWVACYGYEYTLARSLCLRKVIPPPSG